MNQALGKWTNWLYLSDGKIEKYKLIIYSIFLIKLIITNPSLINWSKLEVISAPTLIKMNILNSLLNAQKEAVFTKLGQN